MKDSFSILVILLLSFLTLCLSAAVTQAKLENFTVAVTDFSSELYQVIITFDQI